MSIRRSTERHGEVEPVVNLQHSAAAFTADAAAIFPGPDGQRPRSRKKKRAANRFVRVGRRGERDELAGTGAAETGLQSENLRSRGYRPCSVSAHFN